ncbi:hypothetical protein SAMN02745181_0035 [Rubritalea squalenifaciens DSM 18772]|uniref:Lipoprotein n=2 Tax=Rubritalea squalenifaciens TaxID=407226 RepID=A0A1M6AU81_9BACT|nr:hypothetical protein SAMN02745181_0035 [Rubritalea squalenifaciens DSM 18772]
MKVAMKFKTAISIIGGSLAALSLSSCMTTYDAQGNPVQSVDPAAATVGIVGAGLIGAALADDDDHHHHHRHHGHHYRRRH